MAVELVIKISDSFYHRLIDMNIDNDTCSFNESALVEAIQNGTPLPKGHGRLIDADVLVDGMEDDYEFCEAVNATPTIIKADKENNE